MAVLDDSSLLIYTLAHLVPTEDHSGEFKTLQKRARHRYHMTNFALQMVDLDSDLAAKYWRSYWCARRADVGVDTSGGVRMMHRYCKQRWCSICNSNRAAELINSYKPGIDKIKKPKFVTLTRRNVPGEKLGSTISGMHKAFAGILRAANKAKCITPGIRALEVTYSHCRDDFHPHFHVITGYDFAHYLLTKWMQFNGNDATPRANMFKPCNVDAYKEIFKYVTPLSYADPTSKSKKKRKNTDPNALDFIYRTVENVRLIQAFGGLRKSNTRSGNSNSILIKQVTAHWDDDVHDWVSEHGQLVTGFEPNETDKRIQDAMRQNYYKPK